MSKLQTVGLQNNKVNEREEFLYTDVVIFKSCYYLQIAPSGQMKDLKICHICEVLQDRLWVEVNKTRQYEIGFLALFPGSSSSPCDALWRTRSSFFAWWVIILSLSVKHSVSVSRASRLPFTNRRNKSEPIKEPWISHWIGPREIFTDVFSRNPSSKVGFNPTDDDITAAKGSLWLKERKKVLFTRGRAFERHDLQSGLESGLEKQDRCGGKPY